MRISNVICLSIILLSSCVNTKRTGGVVWVKRNQNFYKTESLSDDILAEYKVAQYFLKSGGPAKIINAAEEQSEFKFFGVKPDEPGPIYVVDQKFKYKENYFSPFGLVDLMKKGKYETYLSEKVKFVEIKPVWQAISIPLKIRPKIKETFYSAEGGNVNLGIAYGWKFSNKIQRNIYSKDKKFLTKNVKDLSLTPGLFCGPSLVKLNSTRSIAGINAGTIGVVSIDQVSVGFALGLEYALENKTSWIYNGKPWLGFVLGFDFIK